MERRGDTITVVGAGLSGLFAAITAAEQGARVTVLEKSGDVGGRARSSDGDWVANFGPHALYSDGAMWEWLEARDLLPPTVRAPARGVVWRRDGRTSRRPPGTMMRAKARIARTDAPSDVAFSDWAGPLVGPDAAAILAAACVNVTFDHDPGRLAADFVRERLVRIFRLRTPVRYVAGGWTRLVEGVAAHARRVGVEIRTGQRVSTLPEGLVVVATEAADARQLVRDPTLDWPGTRAVLVDVGLQHRRRDPTAVFDLDAPALVERLSGAGLGVAPDGADLIQAHAGLRPGEDVDEGARRIEAILDDTFPDWRRRKLWGRRMLADGRTGAIDLPGTTWRDRPRTRRAHGVHVAGDVMAAPGILGEVALNSAIEAGRAAAAEPAPAAATR